MAQITEEQRAEIQEAFSMFDKNGDGQISRTEIIEAMRACGQNVTDSEAKEMIDEIDDNNNGFIDFPEFFKMMSKKGYKSRDESEMEMRAAFAVFDRDNNGYISTAELRKTMESLGEPLTPAELDDMIMAADKNNDGVVDYKEFSKLMAQS